MSAFETYECDNCGDEFEAHSDSNAVERAACSPNCETALLEG